MLPQDCEQFLTFVRTRDPVLVVERDSDSPQVVPVSHPCDSGKLKLFSLWNKALLPELSRKYIADARPGPYYGVNDFDLPVLEFSTSFRVVWDGKPALGKGRIYGTFEGKPPEFERWYEAIVRWIRKNFRRSPTKMGGYLGPSADAWFREGGYLLPSFSPPETEAWLGEIRKQHG
jgi:hypothetical protein